MLLISCDTRSTSDRSIIFTSDNPEAGENTFFLVQSASTEDTIELTLMASNIIVDRAYGVAFDLDFDPTVITFLGFEKGSYFEDNGQFTANYLAALQSNDNSKLVVGITQQGKKFGVIGQGILATFKFKGLKEGTSPVRFSNNVMMNPAMASVSGIFWVGGHIRVEM